jgi:hypothetical protein
MFGMDPRSRASIVLSIVLGIASTPAVRGSEISSFTVPQNIQVDAGLADIVERVLQASLTFRNQCRRLGRLPHVRVRLILDLAGPGEGQSRCRAQCVMARYEFGHIDAAVRLWSVENAPELIAHELEHVLEYAEGTNYRMLSLRPATGVWVTRNGHFESARAIDAGERVVKEIARSRPTLSAPPLHATWHDRARP